MSGNTIRAREFVSRMKARGFDTKLLRLDHSCMDIQVSRSLSSLSIKSPVPSVLQRLSSRTLRGLPNQNVPDSNVPLRELALQTPPDMMTPFTQRLQV